MLPADRELTVVTHALPVAMVLADAAEHHAAPRRRHGARPARSPPSGTWAERELADVHADVAFLGTNGLSVEHGLTTPDLAEAAVKRALVAARPAHGRARGPHASSAATSSPTCAAVAEVDTIITDSEVEPDIARRDRGRRPAGGDRMIVTAHPEPEPRPRPRGRPAASCGEVNRAQAAHCVDAGGKGINVARVLAAHGIPTLAVLPAGGADGARMVGLLRPQIDVPTLAVPIDGAIRRTSRSSSRTGATTKLNAPGADAHRRTRSTRCSRRSRRSWHDAARLRWSRPGSLPLGAPDDFYAAGRADWPPRHGVPFALDTSGRAAHGRRGRRRRSRSSSPTTRSSRSSSAAT